MGKNKRPQKTKELSVAIAEASAIEDETRQEPQTPRKRGRPRKIIEKIESEVKKEESRVEGTQATEQVIGSQSEKVKTSPQEEEQKVEIEESWRSSSTRGKTKEEEKSEMREPPGRSRRRKGKPRKSS
ncbi:PREDICTED: uncharacterized protein LOC105115908 [Populus euphratica]|uniref:Uncharacterized protein LOC105115908 n=1 Tax=Populus euphratica TaxID=75702 RepID=A0AAJ6XAD9_POPEU|nr:PREDICTED: uncharacterized protein LOC105115908 [Populus euphratica]